VQVAVIADIHDQQERVFDALALIEERQIDHLLLLGDFCAPFTMRLFSHFPGQLFVVFGNGDGDRFRATKIAYEVFGKRMTLFGEFAQFNLEQRRIAMIHDNEIGQALAETERYDIVLYGHDHRWHESRIGNTLLLNPGTLGGKGAPPTFALIDLPTLAVEKITL
jgi:putative phosphoesterase